uniref:Uncharacterized protein n=1 Tax=viral metagenome TaxID=1070528 RepID=A0A6C0BY44_9ZZZZ
MLTITVYLFIILFRNFSYGVGNHFLKNNLMTNIYNILYG